MALIQDLNKTVSAIQLWRVVLIQDLDKTGSEPRSSLAEVALDSSPCGVDALGLLDGPALVGVLALDCFVVGAAGFLEGGADPAAGGGEVIRERAALGEAVRRRAAAAGRAASATASAAG